MILHIPVDITITTTTVLMEALITTAYDTTIEQFKNL